VARCDTARNDDKSRDSRNAPVLGTHSTENVPKCVVLHNFEVKKIISSFHCAIVDKKMCGLV
jgi:hypothetical protein